MYACMGGIGASGDGIGISMEDEVVLFIIDNDFEVAKEARSE